MKATALNGNISLTFDGQVFHFLSKEEAQDTVNELLRAIRDSEAPPGLGINVADSVRATTHMG